MQEYSPDTLAALEEAFGGLPTIEERRLLEIVREELDDPCELSNDEENENRFRRSLRDLKSCDCEVSAA